MVKFKQGGMTNADGVYKDITVKSKTPNKLKDIIIGSTLIVGGVLHIAITAFKNGSETFEKAEFETMKELGIIQED